MVSSRKEARQRCWEAQSRGLITWVMGDETCWGDGLRRW